MARNVRFLNSAGTLVLDLSSTGYELVFDGVNVGERTWRRNTVTSPWVDGFAQASAVLGERTAEVTVRCIGTTSVQVEQRTNALIDAASSSSWLLEVDLDGAVSVFRANNADSSYGLLTVEVDNFYRTVSLSIPVQPTPTVTGI